jgi:hypothetical protein
MPPVNPQGSRTALITWSVVCSILFVTSTIFAIYFYVAANEAQEQFADSEKLYADVVTDADLNSPVVNDLKSLRQSEDAALWGVNASMPALNVALAQRDALARLVAGTNAPATALRSGRETLNRAAAELKTSGLALPNGENMALSVRTLVDGMKARLNEIANLNQALAAAKQQEVANQQQMQAQVAKMDETLKQIRAEQAEAMAGLEQYRSEKDQSFNQVAEQSSAAQQAAQDAMAQREVQIQERDRQIAELQKELDRTRERLSGRRANTQDPVVRQADGRIVKVPGGDIVFVDLGQGDSITAGLTFEVYDKGTGIPPAGDPTTEENLPEGKASIEVQRVGPFSSEARITRRAPGAVISEGDPIVNLVYDRNTKYNFLVYGNFDLDQDGEARPGDADIVRRLITQWGGSLVDQVTVDTDFVVLGKEPIMPVYTSEDRQDPFVQKKLADAQAEIDAYNAVRDRAIQLRVPVLNQNRFLYLIGYYNQARR